jgi:cytochrome P450
MTAAPSYPHDLFTDQVLSDPYEHYRALRDRGPVVWLDAHQTYAVARYAEARAVLGDPGTYCSGWGVEAPGFGWGVHGCAGQGLARMEAHALLTALAEQIDRIDLTAPATAVLNNLINARASVPVTVAPARTTGTGPGGGQDRAPDVLISPPTPPVGCCARPGYAGAGG